MSHVTAELAPLTSSSHDADEMSTDKTAMDDVVLSLPPSHILPDGRFVHLAPPTDLERRRFLERSIARHGLLDDDLADKKKKAANDDDDDDNASTTSSKAAAAAADDDATKIHPLALASAKLQAQGMNELNRLINLSNLVQSGEYFGLTNIVDPALEISTTTSESATSKNRGDAAVMNATTTTPTTTKSASSGKDHHDRHEEQSIKASYILKRKRSAFLQASTVLARHAQRLTAGLVAQTCPDARFQQLRPQWRLAAPEHGHRARPHAIRSNEVVAVDVDMYSESMGGRLASHIPRYATLELTSEYNVKEDVEKWRELYNLSSSSSEDRMDVDMESEVLNVATKGDKKTKDNKGLLTEKQACFIRAEPFSIADPTLGRLATDSEAKPTAMLSLQFEIEKSSTGFRQSAGMKSVLTTLNVVSIMDESVLIALQHSLFCAKLFESIRRELAPDTTEEEISTTVSSSMHAQSVVWLTSVAEENYLPAPNALATTANDNNGLAPLCVIHCHEGEVKVQLDGEYTLCVKLVEVENHCPPRNEGNSRVASSRTTTTTTATTTNSGSQSPEQLAAFCRALLWQAQEAYHTHALQAAAVAQKRENEEIAVNDNKVHQRKIEAIPPPCILQRCVSLGTKLLMEARIRKRLIELDAWLASTTTTISMDDDGLHSEWLALSFWDMHAHFTLQFQTHAWDVTISGDEVVVTSFDEYGDYRKAKFTSDALFVLYFQNALGRILRRQQQQQQASS